MKKTVFLFCSGIDNVLSGSPKVAGIQVQMSFWGRTFVKHGWKVVSFSDHKDAFSVEGIGFVKKTTSKLLSKLHLIIVQDLLDCLRCTKTNPEIIIVRGASRSHYFLSKLCRKKKILLLYFGASDSDFVPGKEIIGGSSMNRRLYQKAIKFIDFFITQNETQHDSLKRYYGKESQIIPNIWIPFQNKVSEKKYDAVWISNLWSVKRAEWFVELAKHFPNYQFAMVGGVSHRNYYDHIKHQASKVNNLSFLGAQPFDVVNAILSESKLLVCTSEFEGFPNTFLQAWAQSVPIVSTVNPSGLLTGCNLGVVVEDEESLQSKTELLLTNAELYSRLVKNIEKYFLEHHSADVAFDKLMELINYNSEK